MKITKVNTTVVQNEPPYVGGKYFLFLHLETDEGIVGIGEKVTGSSFNSSNWSDFKSQINLINETAEAFVIGESPFNTISLISFCLIVLGQKLTVKPSSMICFIFFTISGFLGSLSKITTACSGGTIEFNFEKSLPATAIELGKNRLSMGASVT